MENEEKLAAIAIRRGKDKKLTRNQYYNFVNTLTDDYSTINLSPEEMEKITRYMNKLSTGSSAVVPLKCTGPVCPFRDDCPLYAIGRHPMGKLCLIEAQLSNYYMQQYMEEYDVDPDSPTEVGFCNELAEIEIHLTRLNKSLARPENSELVIEQAVSVSREGVPIMQKMLSPYMDQKERLLNRKSKIIKLMVGDRQEKYKKESALKKKGNDDVSSQMALMRRKLEALGTSISKAEPSLEIAQKTLTPDEIISSEDEIEIFEEE